MKSMRTRSFIGLAGLLMAAMPALAQEPAPTPAPAPAPATSSRPFARHPEMFLEERFWLGYSRPDAHDAFWQDNFRTFDLRRNDLQGLALGDDAVLHLDRYNAVSIEIFSAFTDPRTGYRSFADNHDSFVRHDTQFSVGTIGLAYMLFPAGTHTPVIPYLGAGVGLNVWDLREQGSFLGADDSIYHARLEDHGVAPGYFFLAGLEVPVSRWIAVIVDARYNKAHDDLGRDFAGAGRIDLSGGQVGAGVALHL